MFQILKRLFGKRRKRYTWEVDFYPTHGDLTKELEARNESTVDIKIEGVEKKIGSKYKVSWSRPEKEARNG